MFEPSPQARVFGLPPGADFPDVLVAGLLARLAGGPAEAIARVTVYLNTARMLRHVREALSRRGPLLMPRLRLIADLGRAPLGSVPPAVPPLRRRLELARLVAALAERRPDLTAGSAAYDLADSLARLMDEMQGEGVGPEALERPEMSGGRAEHWERSLAFLRIIAAYTGGTEAPDPEARQRRVIEETVRLWADAPPADPIIVAGSTGSRGATALFMEAVARLPQGALVLPGYDADMPDAVWTALGRASVPIEDHPQYRFARLLARLSLSPRDVLPWHAAEVPAARNRLVSLALRPAPVTDGWLAEGPALKDVHHATADMTLVEAPTERLEAVAIAVRLRKAAEDGLRAALVTPNRVLTRRVAAALDRWGIVPDDSAGQPLHVSPPGRFLRQTAALPGTRLTAAALLEILKHPLTATGGPEGASARGAHLRLTRELELSLRRQGPAFPSPDDILRWGDRPDDPERRVWAEWLAAAISPAGLGGPGPLLSHVAAHLDLAGTLAAGPDGSVETSGLWAETAGAEARALMDGLVREAGHGGNYSPAAYVALLDSLLSAESARRAEGTHPRIAIWGTLEARVQGADLVILAGLNEGIWPAAPSPDPWLSRDMRRIAGLLSPERQIGLSAHDFQQAVAAREVVLTRALRDDEAETVPSRWIARLTHLLEGLPAQGGRDALRAMRDRGAYWLDLARRLDAPPERPVPARRPGPMPPVVRRPRQLSVTEIRTLFTDPYAVYARHVLRLRPLEPLTAGADPRLRGEVLHRVMQTFATERRPGETADAAAARLVATAERILDAEVPWPTSRRLWLARIARIADRFAAAETGRNAAGRPILVEERGRAEVGGTGFVLTARPDRIDLRDDGTLHIIDYKTGELPSRPSTARYELQLALEAGMARRGAFARVPAVPVSALTYVRLGGEGEELDIDASPEALDAAWDRLVRLIAAYDRPGTWYTPRRVFSDRPTDYDPISRYGEWLPGDDPLVESMG